MTQANTVPSSTENMFQFGDHSMSSMNSQANGIPMYLNAVERVGFSGNGKPFVICDYGAHDGTMSMGVMKQLIDRIRKKHGEKQQVIIIYEDLPSNDFSTLFKIINGETEGPPRYSLENDNVFVMATGRSYYSQCTSDGFVNFGYSMLAMHRLSKSPCCLSDAQLHVHASDPSERKRFTDQAAEDWETILLKRAKELAPGGQFVIGLAAEEDDEGFYTSDTKGDFHALNLTWRAMADNGRITEEEFKNTNVNTYIRTKKELLEPFRRDGSPVLQAGLRLVEISMLPVACPLAGMREEITTRKDDNLSRKYAVKLANTVRHWYTDNLLSGLSEERPVEERAQLVGEAFQNFEDLVAASPQDHTNEHYSGYVHVEKIM